MAGKVHRIGSNGSIEALDKLAKAKKGAEAAQARAEAEGARRRAEAEATRKRIEETERQARAIEDAKRRTWTSVDGRFAVDAKFVSAVSGVVTLEKDDGKTISVNLNQLSREDQDFIVYRKWISGKPTPPTPEPAAPTPVGEPPTALSTVTNSIGMTLVQIPAGEFLMGSPDSDREASSDEKPQHRVRITRPFHLGAFEVTQSQYQQVMESNPSYFKDESGLLPAENFSWADTQKFCAKLSDLPEEKRAGRQYRLPTEAEWEYACRAGSASRYGFDESKGSLGSYAWFSENSGSKTHPVGQKKPNAWGLYDMHGNVYEWCSDWYGNYDALAVDDPRGPMAGSYRVLRGGSWDSGAWYCRSAAPRRGHTGGGRGADLGFRVALSLVDASGR